MMERKRGESEIRGKRNGNRIEDERAEEERILGNG